MNKKQQDKIIREIKKNGYTAALREAIKFHQGNGSWAEAKALGEHTVNSLISCLGLKRVKR